MRSKLAILAIVSGLLIGGLLISLAVLWYQPDDLRCNLEDLILKDELMPSGWQKQWYVLPPALPEEGAQDALAVQFDRDNISFAHHTVYRYRNQMEAIVWLRVNRELYFPSSWHWSALDASARWGLVPDETTVQCADTGIGGEASFRCNALMRYGPFVSKFGSPVGAGLMSIEEFKKIVVTIDKTFSACLR